jgi:hypothetical protein
MLLGMSAFAGPLDGAGHSYMSSIGGTVVSAYAQTTPQAAIQQVIQRANDEQAQAIATRSPAVMSDTATAAYYRQLVQTNQQMLASGVTSISLAQIQWGPITVNGTTATATTYETWSTTVNGSPTRQSQDTNVYTLVQQNGSWLISADQHPSSGSGQARPGASTPAPSRPAPSAPAPSAPIDQDTSNNWSGYAASGGNYTSVSGTWTVPQPAANGAPGVGATWVGIGGVSSHDLIQAGTQDVVSGDGQFEYQAWIETLPQASHPISLAVKAGDSVTVSIDEQTPGSGMWSIAFKNNTTGETYQKSVKYASSHSSAEWVEEAPSSGRGILPLDDFGSVAFSGASAVKNGQSVNLLQAGAQPISMLGTNHRVIATPSAIGSDGSSFTVARTQSPTPPRTARGIGGSTSAVRPD